MRSFKFIFLIFLALNATVSIAQDETVEIRSSVDIDRTTYEGVKDQLDLTKTKKALRPKESKPKEQKKKKRSWSFSGFQNLGIFEVISYILILCLVSALIYVIFINVNVERKFELSTDNIDIDDFEDIQSLDTAKLLTDALASNDLRTAVRIKFLTVLKNLSSQEKIDWRREKTNRDYSRELRSESYGTEFNELTYIFDHVWYGKQQLSKAQYDTIEPQFDSFTKALNG